MREHIVPEATNGREYIFPNMYWGWRALEGIESRGDEELDNFEEQCMFGILSGCIDVWVGDEFSKCGGLYELRAPRELCGLDLSLRSSLFSSVDGV